MKKTTSTSKKRTARKAATTAKERHVLYANISAANKKYVKTQGKALKSQSVFVDKVLTAARKGKLEIGTVSGR